MVKSLIRHLSSPMCMKKLTHSHNRPTIFKTLHFSRALNNHYTITNTQKKVCIWYSDDFREVLFLLTTTRVKDLPKGRLRPQKLKGKNTFLLFLWMGSPPRMLEINQSIEINRIFFFNVDPILMVNIEVFIHFPWDFLLNVLVLSIVPLRIVWVFFYFLQKYQFSYVAHMA